MKSIIFDFNLKELTISNRKSTLRIEGINFEVKRNDISFAILGESGIGKTTIFRSLFARYVNYWAQNRNFSFNCDHRFKTKTFSNADIIKNNVPFKIGFATQQPFFFENETVEENLFKPSEWKKTKYSEDAKSKLIDLFELGDIVKNQMFILSGGQRQLINIIRMLTLKPGLAIIDECFSSMNEKMAQKNIKIIKTNYADCIFLITSHRLSDINFFGSKYISLKKEAHKNGKFYVTQI